MRRCWIARLEEAFGRERRFMSDASHELRTPLGILKTELEVALRGEYSKASRITGLGRGADGLGRIGT